MVRPIISSLGHERKLTRKEKEKIMEELGFDANDGYDYTQHLAPPCDPGQQTIFISCNEQDFEVDSNSKSRPDTIITEVYTDSITDSDESYKSCEETQIDLDSIFLEMNSLPNSNSHQHEECDKNDCNDVEMEGTDDALLDLLQKSNDDDDSTEISHSSVPENMNPKHKHDPVYLVTLEPSLKSDILEYIRSYDSSSESTDFSMYSEEFDDTGKSGNVTLDKAEIALAKYELPELYADCIRDLRISDSCDSDDMQSTFSFQLPSLTNATTEPSSDKKLHKKTVKEEKRKRREVKSSNRAEFNKELQRQKNMRKNNISSKRINP